MFKIKTTSSEEVLEHVTYVKLQSNGVIVTCDNVEDAHGVLNKNHSIIYAFKDSPISDSYETAEVFVIALDDYLNTYLNQNKLSTLPEKVSNIENKNKEQIELNYQQQSDIDYLMLLSDGGMI